MAQRLLVLPILAMHESHHPPKSIQVARARPKRQRKDPDAQPSELILFPKLKIYFADFPYLLCSMAQRLLALPVLAMHESTIH